MAAAIEHTSVQEPEQGNGFTNLVNELTRELSQVRRSLATAQTKLDTSSRALEARTQELMEARAALALLLATLDSTADGILAMGYFGRAMHYNTRFIEIWGLPADKLATLNESALLTIQLAQVKDPERFLAHAQARKNRPDDSQFSLIEMTDGRILECHVLPQRVRGRRVGSVTRYHDVTERERLGRVISLLETEWPEQVAEARATTY